MVFSLATGVGRSSDLGCNVVRTYLTKIIINLVGEHLNYGWSLSYSLWFPVVTFRKVASAARTVAAATAVDAVSASASVNS